MYSQVRQAPIIIKSIDLPTRASQSFYVDAFPCQHRPSCGYKYCNLMRDGASQIIYCNLTRKRSADEVIKSFTKLWNLNPSWLVYDAAYPDLLNSRFIRIDTESAYTSEDILEYTVKRGYKIVFTAPRDKHAGGIAERMVGLLTSKTNSTMMKNGATPSYWR